MILTLPITGLPEFTRAQTESDRPESIQEYYLKAAFLVNFARLVEWPASMENAQHIVIGVLDQVPFGDALTIIQKKEIHGKKIITQLCDSTTDYTGVHILFLNSDDIELRKLILNKIGSSPILTIGETWRFAQEEGIINFYKHQNKLRFEINPAKAEKMGLKISSRLFKLGRLVH